MLKKALLITVLTFFMMSGVSADEGKKEEEVNSYELLNLFAEVMERAKATYVEEISDKKLIESAINGMLVSLDPHSSYLDKKDFKYMTEQTSGRFGGLGIEITMEQGLVKIISPIDDTPAFRAGLKAGDYITNIDGETIIGMTLNEAVEKMRGKPGTKVKLTIRRLNEKPFDVTIKREEIKTKSVKVDVKDEDVKLAKKILTELRLGEKMNQPFCLMSKGERQCVLIARALNAKPEILILDEPGTGLDVFAREYVMRTIDDLAVKTDLTIIYVTHYPEEMLPSFDQAMLLREGRIFAKGKTKEVFTTETISDFMRYPIEVAHHEEKQNYTMELDVESYLDDLVFE